MNETAPQPLHNNPLSLSKFDRIDIVEIPRSRLKNAPYNPRKITPAALIDLRKSIQQHGLVEPLIWNERTGNLVGGHQRLSQLDILEGSPNYLIHVNKVNIDERSEIALNITLNNPNIQGEYDVPVLIDLLRNDRFDTDMTGFKPVDFEFMALNAGMDTSLIDSMFSPEAVEQINSMTAEIDMVMDQSDHIRKRNADQAKAKGKAAQPDQSPQSPDESQPPKQASSSSPKPRRQQPQDEDDTAEVSGKSTSGAKQPVAEPAITSSPPVKKDGPYSEEYFSKTRRRESDSTRAQRQQGYYLTLSFATNEQKFAFCRAIGADERTPYYDGPTVAAMLNIQLPPATQSTQSPAPEVLLEILDDEA